MMCLNILYERFGADFNQADQLFFDQIREEALADHAIHQAARVNINDDFRLVF
jgi:type I restriction enzyme R subunit